MTTDKMRKIRQRMLLILPAMMIFMIGDYCIGIEPTDSETISGMISSGWLAIADWRITLSNLCGFVGTVFYSIAALSFLEYLKYHLTTLKNQWDRRILQVFMAGLFFGIMGFMYFHIACGTLIHNYNVITAAAEGNTEWAVELWNRSYGVQAVCYWLAFLSFDITVTVAWIALVLKRVIPLKKVWILAAPLMMTGIGFLLEMVLPLPFNGFASGFESSGWAVMFLGGVKWIRNAEIKEDL